MLLELRFCTCCVWSLFVVENLLVHDDYLFEPKEMVQSVKNCKLNSTTDDYGISQDLCRQKYRATAWS